MSVRDLIFGAAPDMTPVQFIDKHTVINGSNGTELVFTKSALAQAGDLITLFVAADATSTWSNGDGFTEHVVEGGTGESTRLYTKIATGSEPATYTFTSSASGRLSGLMMWHREAAVGWLTDQIVEDASGTDALDLSAIGVPRGGVLLAFFTAEAGSLTWSTPSGMSVVDSDSDNQSMSWAVFSQEYGSAASGVIKSSTPSASAEKTGWGFVLYPKNIAEASNLITPIGTPTQQQNSSNGNTLVLDKPLDVLEGHYMLAWMTAGGATAQTWTGDTDWVEIADQGASPNLRLAYKVAGPSEPSTYTFTSSDSGNKLSGGIAPFANAAFDNITSFVTATTGGAVTLSGASGFDFAYCLAIVACSTANAGDLSVAAGIGEGYLWPSFVTDDDGEAPSWGVLRRYLGYGAGSVASVRLDPGGTTGNVAGVLVFLKQD